MGEKPLIGKFYMVPTFYDDHRIFIIHAWSDIFGSYISTDITLIDKPPAKEYLEVPSEDELETVMDYSELKKFFQYEKDKYSDLAAVEQELLQNCRKEMGRHRARYTSKEIRNGLTMKRAVRKAIEVSKQVCALASLRERWPNNEHLVHEYIKATKGYRRALKPIYSKLSKENMEVFLDRLNDVMASDNWEEKDPEYFFESKEIKMIKKVEKKLDAFWKEHADYFS